MRNVIILNEKDFKKVKKIMKKKVKLPDLEKVLQIVRTFQNNK